MKHRIGTLLYAVLLLAVNPAKAQITVFDPANLGQNALTAAHTLQQIENQVTQLEHEVTMLTNQARNLTTLPFNIVSQLRAALALTTQLISQAQGIPFQLTQAQSQFSRFYPTSYGSGTSGAGMAADSLQRWLHSLQALQTTISMQAQSAQNLAVDESSLATLVGQSQGAIGILQASNATNQLLALQSRQSIQEHQLRLTQDRSAALEQARAVAEEARSREVRIRFEGSGMQYNAQPINFYGF
jgi:P-type conjugative transfer protein TrbJ